MAIEWITHKGRQILYVDYQECEPEPALIELLEESARIILSQPGRVRLIGNFTGISIGPEYMNRLKRIGPDISRNKLEKSAVVRIGGLISILVDGYFRTMGDKHSKVFETMEEALDWIGSI